MLAMLGFPAVSRLAADAQPAAPRAGAALAPLAQHGRAGHIRSLPAFVTLDQRRVTSLVAGGQAAERAEILRLAGALFGERTARRIGRELDVLPIDPVVLPPVPPSRTATANDLAALLILTGSADTFGDSSPLDGAGAIALALLRETQRTGGCAAALNLAFLLSADSEVVHDTEVAHDYARAAAACPGDPTPLWALGEYQSELSLDGRPAGPALATFGRLERAFPRASAAWAGEGDEQLRIGYLLDRSEPFAARQHFARALALYRRAAELQPGAGPWAGAARALAGLNQSTAAVAVQRRAVAIDPSSADLQARLLDYLQRAHEFAAAAGTAATLAGRHRFAAGPQLFAVPSGVVGGSDSDEPAEEDAALPLSTGAGDFEPADITVSPRFKGTKPGGGALLSDLSFIPDYVPVAGVGGLARWCPGWSRLVDLLLSGDPAPAAAAGGSPDDLRAAGDDCSDVLYNGPADLAGVAELELGNAKLVRSWIADGRLQSSLGDLEDLRQNLWRYAGNLARAAAAAAQWAQLQPDNDLARDREGEIAFLRRDYNQSAEAFALVAARARFRHGSPSEDEARALLDQGTALSYRGRDAEALTVLNAAADTAERASATTGDPSAPAVAAYAGEQLAELLLRRHDDQQAAEDYAVAADAASRIAPGSPRPASGVGFRPEALLNNRAIAEVDAGDPALAATLAAGAVPFDSGDAIFWWTEGLADQQLGRSAAAIFAYRRSLALDPTEYPVSNNLGVLLMRRGHNAAAAAVLRRTVGANPGYAIGWFNLGVALSRLGPSHVFSSQGSFGRARALDSSLTSRPPAPVVDDVTYFSRLDLSRPLPAGWNFERSQTQAPVAAAGLSALLLVGLALARALGPKAIPGGAEKWLGLLDRVDERAAWPRALQVMRAPVVGVAATTALLLWPLHGGPTGGWWSILVFTVGVLVLIGVVIRVRDHVAEADRLPLRQETWAPGVAFALVVTLAGLGWCPLPVARSGRRAVRLHWAGPTAVGVLALALLLLAAWLDVPVTRALGAAALVMAASLLTPVKPLDGATVSSTAAGSLPAVAVLGTAVLMLLGVL